MSTRHRIGSKLYDLLSHSTNERKTEFSNQKYTDRIKIYINYHTNFHRGSNLNETNVKNFNLFLETEIKSAYRFYMNFYIGILPNFEANLPAVRNKIGIDLDDWQCDSIKKDYYRYRVKTGRPLLHNPDILRTVPSPKDDLAF